MANDQFKVTEGDLIVRDLRFALVVSRFNDFVVEPLVRGALDALKRHGAAEKQIEIVRVPGASRLWSRSVRSFAARRRTSIMSPASVLPDLRASRSNRVCPSASAC